MEKSFHLHKDDDGSLNIVDGQQRLASLPKKGGSENKLGGSEKFFPAEFFFSTSSFSEKSWVAVGMCAVWLEISGQDGQEKAFPLSRCWRQGECYGFGVAGGLRNYLAGSTSIQYPSGSLMK